MAPTTITNLFFGALAVWLAANLAWAIHVARSPSDKEIAFMKWLELVKNLAPFVLAAIPGMPPVLIPAIVHSITVAEAIPGATGAQKKAAALDILVTSMDTVNAIHPTPLDATALAQVVSLGIDTTVSAINVVHQAQAPAPTSVK